jgi:hypothetical protein
MAAEEDLVAALAVFTELPQQVGTVQPRVDFMDKHFMDKRRPQLTCMTATATTMDMETGTTTLSWALDSEAGAGARDGGVILIIPPTATIIRPKDTIRRLLPGTTRKGRFTTVRS